MRYCKKCGVLLANDNWYGGTNLLCKKCKNQYDREWKKARRLNQNLSFREDEKKRAKKYYHTIAQKRRDDFLAQFKTPCVRCGENDFSCIVFHHIDPSTKSFCVGGGCLGNHSEDEVALEAKKCVCLCENCHRKFHHRYWHQLENPKQNLYEFIKEEAI